MNSGMENPSDRDQGGMGTGKPVAGKWDAGERRGLSTELLIIADVDGDRLIDVTSHGKVDPALSALPPPHHRSH